MNIVLPEMLHCLNAEFPASYFNANEQCAFFTLSNGMGEEVVEEAMKPDPGTENGWGGDLDRMVRSYGNGSEFEMRCGIPVTGNSKKRKVDDKGPNPKDGSGGTFEEKKMRVCEEEEGKITEQNSNSKSTTTTTGSTSNNNKNSMKGTSNSNSKASDAPKLDYIHVRARRGQATDSHSLAERVRREKISERMKYLQDLVPGCNKITGKAGMLDEIINYVQSLQRQVEFLSMKLAAINPTHDFDIDGCLSTEIFPACAPGFPMTRTSSHMVNAAHHLQFNPLIQGVSGSISEMGVNPIDVTLGRTTSSPVSMPDTFLNSSCLNQIQQLTWEDELQNLMCMEYQQGRPTSFTSQPFTGFLEAGHVKLEM